MTDIKLANLPNEIIEEIKELENELGISLIAYVSEDNSYAQLSEEEIKKVKLLESKLKIILLAYPTKKAA